MQTETIVGTLANILRRINRRRINLVTNSGIYSAVAEERIDDEVERLRRMFAVMHETRKAPSRLKKIMERLRTRKIRKSATSRKKTDAA